MGLQELVRAEISRVKLEKKIQRMLDELISTRIEQYRAYPRQYLKISILSLIERYGAFGYDSLYWKDRFEETQNTEKKE